MSSTFAKLADLPLEIESCGLQGLAKDISMGFERLTTVVCLRGGGEEGVGEDVISYPADQIAFQDSDVPQLAGSWTLAEFGAHLDSLDLFTAEPLFGAYRAWRRWAFHSAALDLALRQAGRALHEVLGVAPQPMTFVLSTGLGDPASVGGIRELLGRYPQLRLKLDASACWDDRVLAELAELNAVDTIDFKSFTPDLGDANPADPELYRRVAEALPHAWLEDPNLAAPDAALAPYRDRIAWDTPIRSIADIQGLAFAPRIINVKPSRFGSLRELCAAYDFCAEQGIGVYAGGMFELGPGRGQAQYLASLFHPQAPNDIAPAGYNDTIPADGLPSSPLAPTPTAVGFRWEA
jgi:L-alanine-DL-glutamate epimerase-like enolase superfamily enzyme